MFYSGFLSESTKTTYIGTFMNVVICTLNALYYYPNSIGNNNIRSYDVFV